MTNETHLVGRVGDEAPGGAGVQLGRDRAGHPRARPRLVLDRQSGHVELKLPVLTRQHLKQMIQFS